MVNTKKAVSAYVSWVLILGFVASLSVFMFSFITGQVDNNIIDIEKRGDKSSCEDVGLNIDNLCQNSQTLNMNVTNNNLLSIDQLILRFIDIYDYSQTWTYNISIRPGETEKLELLKQGTLKHAQIIPVIIKNNNVNMCLKSSISLENIKYCG